MEKIIYTKRNKKEEITLEESLEMRSYYKHIYKNDIIRKSEFYYKPLFHQQEIFSKIEIFKYEDDDIIEDENILFENIHISSVKIIRVRKIDIYVLHHKKEFLNLLLEKELFELFELFDNTENLIATYNQRDKDYELYNYKYLYVENEKPLRLQYFDNGKLVKHRKEIESLVGNKEIFPKDYYFNFFPFLPNQEEIITDLIKYFSDDEEINLQQAFFKRNFNSKTYQKGILQKIDYFENNELLQTTHFIYEQKLNLKSYLTNIKVETIIYFLEEEKNGFKRWTVSYFSGDSLTKTEIKVWDFLEKEIYNQEIDIDGNIISTTKKSFFYNNEYSYLDEFEYDKTGKLITTEIFEDDGGWHSIEHKISDLKKDGFFKPEYGRYFAEVNPEIPQLKNVIHSYKKIYRNHLGKIIEKSETKNLYEYSEEIFIDNNLKEKTTYKDGSNFKEIFIDDYVNISAEENNVVLSNSDVCYHNKRRENNYIIYDFAIRKFAYSVGKNKGIVVYDNYFREISRIVFEGFSDVIIYAVKTYYNSPSPIIDDKFTSVIYNKSGEIERYKDNSLEVDAVYSPTEYESDYFFDISPVNNDYYKNIFPFVPERKAFPYIDFEKKEFKSYQHNRELKILTFFEKEKLKIASLKSYQYFYFLPDEKSVLEYYEMLTELSLICFFYDIKITRDEIVASLSYSHEIKARLKIDILTENITCEIFENKENIIAFRKFSTADNSEMYAFYYENERVWSTEFQPEILIELLLQS